MKPRKKNALGGGTVAGKNVTVPRQTPKVEFASASELVAELSDTMLADMLPLIQVRLKQFDSTQNDTIKRLLLMAMINDLKDPEKCTPGLYQAILRLCGEHVPLMDQEMVSGSRMKEMEAELPFK